MLCTGERRFVPLGIGAFFFSIYLLTAGGHYGGDGFWNYLTAESIVLDGDLIIGDRPFLIEEMYNQYTHDQGGGVIAGSGRSYSKYGLGQALVEVPFYAVGHMIARLVPGVPRDYVTMFTTSITNVVVCAFWCIVFFKLARQLSFGRHTLIWITGVFGVGSVVFPYAGYGFSEPLIGLTLLGTVTALHQYRQSGARSCLAWSGALLGLSAATKLYIVIVLPCLAVYLWSCTKSLTRSRQLRAWAALLVPLILFGLLIAWHNWVRYGSILKTGYHLDDVASEFWTGAEGGYFSFSPFNIVIAVYGLLFSAGRGLLLFLPAAFFVPIAILRFGKAHREEAMLFTALIAVHLIFFACFRAWHGGSWGPRYLMPILPFLVLPLGGLIENGGAREAVIKTLAVIGGLIQLPATLMNVHFFTRFVIENRIGHFTYDPRHFTDLVFSPGLSPIAGTFYQLISAVSRLTRGYSLNYPVPSSGSEGVLVSMSSYDLIDVWWVNALRTGFLGNLATVVVYTVVAALFLGSVLTARALIKWSRSSNPAEG